MVTLLVCLTVKNEADIPEVRRLLSEQGRLSRAEPGCQRFEVYHSDANPRRFILCEWWESKESLDVHRTAKSYTTIYQPHVLPKVDREPHPSQLVE